MAIANENVRPAIVVKIEKTTAPAEILRVFAEARGKGSVFKRRAAQIVVQRRRVAGEICFYDVQIPVEIVIAGGNAHSSLWFAVGAEGAAGFHGNVGEFSVFQILIKGAGGGIVGYVNIWPAIVVKIGSENTETVSAVGGKDPEQSPKHP